MLRSDWANRVEIDIVVIVVPEIQNRARFISVRIGNSVPLSSEVQKDEDGRLTASVFACSIRSDMRQQDRPSTTQRSSCRGLLGPGCWT